MAGDELKGSWLDSDLKFLGDGGELFFDFFGGDPTEIEPLAPAKDGGKDFMGLSRCEEEDDVGGGLFEGFEKGVERFFYTTLGWDTPVLNDRAAPLYPRAQTLTPDQTALVDSHLVRLSARMK